MLVYRVEDSDNKGPYNNNTFDFYMILSKYNLLFYYDDDNHISLHDEIWENNLRFCDDIKSKYIFGFTTLDQLINWFYFYGKEVIEELKKYDFHISIYEIEDKEIKINNLELHTIMEDNNQCVFYKEHATLIDTMEL